MGKINKKNFNNNKSSTKKISSPKKKNLEDYAFYIGTKQASDYEVTVEFILNHIKKTYEYGNDTSKSKFNKNKNNNNNESEKETPLSFVQNEDTICFKSYKENL